MKSLMALDLFEPCQAKLSSGQRYGGLSLRVLRAGLGMVAKRDYRFITLDVLELAAQTPDRDLADSLRHLVVAYNALARSNWQRLSRPPTTLPDRHGRPERVSADGGKRVPLKP